MTIHWYQCEQTISLKDLGSLINLKIIVVFHMKILRLEVLMLDCCKK